MSQIKNAQIRYRVIDRALRNQYNPFPTKEDLRRACEEAIFGSTEGTDICDSTIEKDMFAMRMEFDAPIKYSKKDRGYYYEDEHFSIDKIPLSEDDVDAIKFAASTLMQFRDVGIFKQFGFAIDKIFDRVHIANNPMDDSVENFVQFENQPTTSGNDMLPELLKAIKEGVVVKFGYQGYKGGKFKERTVFPLLLKEYRNRWYLLSYDTNKGKIITYGLERISDLEITEEYFNEKIKFDPAEYFEYATGITVRDGQKPVKVSFKVDKTGSKYLQSQPLHKSQVIVKEGKNRDTFEMKVLLSDDLIRTILSYGPQMEVIKPNSLREKVAKYVHELNDIYGS